MTSPYLSLPVVTVTGSESTTEYRRNARGEVIHRADCKRVGKGSHAWEYARGFTAQQIAEAIDKTFWLHPCGVCRPDVERQT